MNIYLIYNFRIVESLFTKISDDINHYYKEFIIIDSNNASILFDTIFLWRLYSYSVPLNFFITFHFKRKVKEILSEFRTNVKIACNKKEKIKPTC